MKQDEELLKVVTSVFEMVFPHVLELVLESQIHHSAALAELAVHGKEVSSLQEAAAATSQGSAPSIPEQTVVQRTQVPFRCGGQGASQCTFWAVAAVEEHCLLMYFSSFLSPSMC